jgi:hypothetical protein
MTGDDAVKCPNCGSIQVHAEKRGWRLTTGFFGSGKIVLTCLKCGHSFRPGDYATYSTQEKSDTQVGCVVLAAIVVICVLLSKACSR